MNTRLVTKISQALVHRRWLMRILGGIHVAVYRLTGGFLGGLMLGVPTLLLTTCGRRTGRLFTTPLYYLPDGDSLVVVASAGGSDSEPAWWKNLQQQPQAVVEMGPVRLHVRAEQACDEAKARLWPTFVRVRGSKRP